jgi:hypothetical protein
MPVPQFLLDLLQLLLDLAVPAAQCPSCAQGGRDRSRNNLGIKISDPRFYVCRAGCSKEEIRAALGQPIRKSATV